LKLQNWLLFLLVAFLWGSLWPVMKIGLRFVSPITFAMQRFIISALIMLPVPLLQLERIPKDSNTLGKLTILSLINASNFIATLVGLEKESSGIGAVLYYTQPLFVFCLAALFLKEKITTIKLSGAIMGLVGTLILFHSRISSFTSYSTLLILLGAFLASVALVYYKKYLTYVGPVFTNFFQLSIGAVSLALLNILPSSFILPLDGTYLWIILYSSVGALVVGTTIWLFLLKEEEATILSGSSFIIPLVALILGQVLLGESVRIESMFGSALILGGVFLVNLKSRGRKTEETRAKPVTDRY
jgi:drug/metabolite transporter (DMT)-like permease